jgi:purine catabolism regulator
MNVEQLLKTPEFKDFKLIAGAGGSCREISSVNVIDSPDCHSFFRGGEFLLTNTYIMRDDISILKDITTACAKIGVSAIGIKLARFIKELPEDYIAMANELNFPVIQLPVDVAFESIISRVYTEIVNNQCIRLDYSEKVHSSFTQLVLQGGSTHQILHNLSELIGREVCYYDTYFEMYYDSRSDQRIPIDQAPLPLQEALMCYPHHLLEVSGTNYGFLVEMEDAPTSTAIIDNMDYVEIAVQHASTVLKLNSQKEISNRQIESRHRDEFVQGLLLDTFSSTVEIDARQSIYGWSFKNGIVAVVIGWDENTWEHNGYDLDTFLSRKIKQVYPRSMYTKLGAQLVFLLEPGKMPLNQFMKEIQQTLLQLAPGMKEKRPLNIHVGVGSYKHTLKEAHLSYREAQTAEQIGRKLQQRVTCYEELGLYRLLSQISDSQAVSEFLNRHIRKLVEHDAAHNSEYVKTLEFLIANDWNLQKTAESLYIHYNTIKNRYYKISEILSEDLNDPDVKMNLIISLKLMQLEK